MDELSRRLWIVRLMEVLGALLERLILSFSSHPLKETHVRNTPPCDSIHGLPTGHPMMSLLRIVLSYFLTARGGERARTPGKG